MAQLLVHHLGSLRTGGDCMKHGVDFPLREKPEEEKGSMRRHVVAQISITSAVLLATGRLCVTHCRVQAQSDPKSGLCI